MQLLFEAMAIWYMAHLLVKERGPWGIFARLRRGAGIDYDTIGNATPRHELGAMLLCITCTSFWLAVAVIAIQGRSPWLLGVYGGISVLINRYMEG